MAQNRPRRHAVSRPQPAPLFAETGPSFYDQDQDQDFDRSGKRRGSARKKRRKKVSGRNILYDIAIVIFAAVFLVCGGLLVKRYFDDQALANEMTELESLIDEDAQPQTSTASGTDAPAEESNAVKFARLSELNPDFVGWIRIEDTNLSFPVMQSVDRKDFYLNHNFEGEYDVYGVPYLDEDCVLSPEGQSNNFIIYGHHMKSGTVFGSLPNYRDYSYYQEHPYIEFDTLYGDATYEVFAAFAIDVVTDSFTFNTYINMDEASFADFISQVEARSSLDTGITPVYGDQLLTLSTCDYSSDNGRFVVCARRVTDQ